MLLIVGTVPNPSLPLVHGSVRLENDALRVENHRLPIGRGTPALAAAAAVIRRRRGGEEVFVLLAGDIGRGDGSRAVYEYLVKNLRVLSVDVLVFHYLQPDVDWHNKVLFAVDDMPRRPRLIADAGYMYAAKMSGQAAAYDIFTPDKGELAFLADEKAPHPFYTRGFLLHDHHSVEDLVHRAYTHGDAARWLVVKGETDHIADSGRIVANVTEPIWEPMEAIGGTGDTLTGILAALCASGHDFLDACLLAALTNRWAGHIARPTPATQIAQLVGVLPEALTEAQKAMKGETKRGER
ncbi:NAD(P)H-hydrate dehydratase [Desulfosoma caldarium]|uniref:NAD(P)H-hydrate repair Nnr-like enzyme with NAD(P)H-hydrate dehydratase domain n=1 Tax=Desulfosoma caldarium TaxID=610254 RepID=A0A3N1VPH7_9BACT|nr:NAD(P)H-hydrate dehydratase [Desulfosoma caldarium]ROR02928.1 NAD(P)H-hydrate repair Nnr-like enzyme with NAD(P)H-hydrate dehydratase domain [Desulfosoma caldarium]